MKKNFMTFCVFIVMVLNQAYSEYSNVLKINIFSINNGKGLEAHRVLLKKALENLGHQVFEKDLFLNPNETELAEIVDINIFMEIICTNWIFRAKSNWLIPHPECFYQDFELLKTIDLILPLTFECNRIFKELGAKTYYLGFTSFDCYEPFVKKKFNSYLHLAGGSGWKGTKTILNSWENELGLPFLTAIIHSNLPCFDQKNINFITNRIPENQLRNLQNKCGIHLCPSETEGFGHYIMEAMSVASVVITTDAPPMNEFIKDKRCLIPSKRWGQCGLAKLYFIESEDLKNTINLISKLSDCQLEEIGNANRKMYLKKTMEFNHRLKTLLSKFIISNKI